MIPIIASDILTRLHIRKYSVKITYSDSKGKTMITPTYNESRNVQYIIININDLKNFFI